MHRREFILTSILASAAMISLNEFAATAKDLKGDAERMPLLFVGHGSPMNAIEENIFSNKWREIGKNLPRPKAILCVSAHWMTTGTFVNVLPKPETIHDFYGFPPELFAANYPAPGSPDFANQTIELSNNEVKPTQDWGLDHGCWSVLLPMFPKADIPVYQLSLDLAKPPSYHYNLAKQLKALRNRGVMIIGSGNIVHNLGMMQWENKAFDWALEFDAWSKERIESGDHQSLIDYDKRGQIAKLAIPTNEHYLPLLYTLALQEKGEDLTFFNEQTVMGSISMRSMIIS